MKKKTMHKIRKIKCERKLTISRRLWNARFVWTWDRNFQQFPFRRWATMSMFSLATSPVQWWYWCAGWTNTGSRGQQCKTSTSSVRPTKRNGAAGSDLWESTSATGKIWPWTQWIHTNGRHSSITTSHHETVPSASCFIFSGQCMCVYLTKRGQQARSYPAISYHQRKSARESRNCSPPTILQQMKQ